MTLAERLETAQDARCGETRRMAHCSRPAAHTGLHSDGETTWGFADNATPEWLRRARESGFGLKDFTGTEAL